MSYVINSIKHHRSIECTFVDRFNFLSYSFTLILSTKIESHGNMELAKPEKLGQLQRPRPEILQIKPPTQPTARCFWTRK
jgi:hypothetical protein